MRERTKEFHDQIYTPHLNNKVIAARPRRRPSSIKTRPSARPDTTTLRIIPREKYVPLQMRDYETERTYDKDVVATSATLWVADLLKQRSANDGRGKCKTSTLGSYKEDSHYVG